MDLKKLSYEFKRHLSDSTASIILYTPTIAALETLVAGMSDLVSINSRMLAAAITYSGAGIVSKIRDYSKEFFGIKKESKEKIKKFHDIMFSITCSFIIKPTIYLVSGETDWKKIAIGTLSSMGIGALFGGPFGYLTDVYRDLTGIKESERTPEILKRQTGRTKKTIAAGLLAASIGLTGLVYTLTPKKEIANIGQRSNLEQVVETTRNQYETIPAIVRPTPEIIKEAMKFRLENKSKNLSVTECISYFMAKELGIKFLTGDKEFEKFESVEFVR